MRAKLTLLLLVSVLTGFTFGQKAERLTNAEYGFSMVPPRKSAAADTSGAIIGFEGDGKRYGPAAQSILSSVKRVSMPMAEVEAYMKLPTTVRMFHNTLVSAMMDNFPDLSSLERGFAEFEHRPAISGTFTFAANGEQMRGRYLIVLVKEQRALYTFTWSSTEKHFKDWNAAAEASVRTFTFTPKLDLSRDDA
jgi:hypothetical protein